MGGFDNVDGTEEDCDICLDYSLLHLGGDEYHMGIGWEYKTEALLQTGGFPPADAIGFYYNPSHWEWADNTISENTDTYDEELADGTQLVEVSDDDLIGGCPFIVRDQYMTDGTWYHATLDITAVGDYEPATRWTAAEYAHTWSGIDLNYSFSVSADGWGLGIDPSKEEYVERTGTEGHGDVLMKTRQDDAV